MITLKYEIPKERIDDIIYCIHKMHHDLNAYCLTDKEEEDAIKEFLIDLIPDFCFSNEPGIGGTKTLESLPSFEKDEDTHK